MAQSKLILPIIVFSQFCCTSLWFAGNAVMSDLVFNFNLTATALGHITSAVQFGFIFGTLSFAVLSISDRFSPSRVFFLSAVLAALFNTGVMWDGNNLSTVLILRFMTGFFLAGIYPVGMKIAADYYQKGLGKSLGYLVGALVLGTAFPHLAKEMTSSISWKYVLGVTSFLALFGGLLMIAFVPDGHYRKPAKELKLSAFMDVFRKPKFRSAAFGYFGHLWELYAFWAFVPIILQSYANEHTQTSFNVPLLSFLIIGIGGLSCIISAHLGQSSGNKRIAFRSLFLSFTVCVRATPYIISSYGKVILPGNKFSSSLTL